VSDHELLLHIHEMLHNLNNPFTALADLARRVGKLEASLMSLKDDFDAAMSSIDEKTTDLGKRIDAIVAKLQNPSVTPEEKTALLNHLTAIGDTLDAMAKDPANPVPEPTPLPPSP